jgi:hypothetical protein
MLDDRVFQELDDENRLVLWLRREWMADYWWGPVPVIKAALAAAALIWGIAQWL